MTQNQLKMLILLFQVTLITAGIYFYVFWRRLDNIAFVYGLVLGITELLIAILLFILSMTRVQITSFGQVARYVRSNCYKEYYALIIINIAFLLASNIIMILDESSVDFTTHSSIHFIIAYCLQAVLFYIFSNDLLKRRTLIPNERIFEREGVLRCGYEVFYYVMSLFVVLNYFFSTHFTQLEEPQQSACQLIIFSLLYLFYSVTKLGILIKVFLFITIVRMIYSAGNSLKTIQDNNLKAIQICVIVISSILIIRLCQQIIKGLMNAWNLYYNQGQNTAPNILGALNMLPQRDAYVRPTAQSIDEELINSLPVHNFKLENEFLCSICDMGLTKDELVMKLPCSHLFHPECIKPWLRQKNTCPNCRSIVINKPQIENNQNIQAQININNGQIEEPQQLVIQQQQQQQLEQNL